MFFFWDHEDIPDILLCHHIHILKIDLPFSYLPVLASTKYFDQILGMARFITEENVIFHTIKYRASSSLPLYLFIWFVLPRFARHKIENTIRIQNKVCVLTQPSNSYRTHKQGQISLSVAVLPHVYPRYLYLAFKPSFRILAVSCGTVN